MKHPRITTVVSVLLLALLASVTGAQKPAEPKDIVDTAIAAGSFKTLVDALKAADLVETLKGKGPFTVFAPTDEAFAKLPAGKLDALLKDKEQLKSLLTYHVLPEALKSEKVLKLTSAKTVSGASLTIMNHAGKVMVDNAWVTKADIVCSNGVIHVIDAVLIPKDIVETAMGDGSFQTLIKALQAADLVETLKGKGPFTVFAPTDEAFAKLPAGQLDALLKDKPKLALVLKYHVVAGKVMGADVAKMKTAQTLAGKMFAISATKEGVRVNNAKVTKTDIVCANGVIHAIDTVLMPKSKETDERGG